MRFKLVLSAFVAAGLLGATSIASAQTPISLAALPGKHGLNTDLLLAKYRAQKKLADWLQCASSPDYGTFDFVTDFDLATVFYESKNEGETFSLTRWSPEQRRRRLQQEP